MVSSDAVGGSGPSHIPTLPFILIKLGFSIFSVDIAATCDNLVRILQTLSSTVGLCIYFFIPGMLCIWNTNHPKVPRWLGEMVPIVMFPIIALGALLDTV